jgi:hypothetical protein
MGRCRLNYPSNSGYSREAVLFELHAGMLSLDSILPRAIWSFLHLLTSPVVVQKQYLNEQMWLCSNKSLSL